MSYNPRIEELERKVATIPSGGEVPVPSGVSDAGKVMTVNVTGTGYELTEPASGIDLALLVTENSAVYSGQIVAGSFDKAFSKLYTNHIMPICSLVMSSGGGFSQLHQISMAAFIYDDVDTLLITAAELYANDNGNIRVEADALRILITEDSIDISVGQ